jgi:hypothetical protein
MKRKVAILIFGLILITILIGSAFSQGAGDEIPKIDTKPQTTTSITPGSPQDLNDKTKNPNVNVEEKDGLVTITVITDSGSIITGTDRRFENLKKGSKITYQKVGELYEPIRGKLEPADTKNYDMFGYDIKVPKGGALEFEKNDKTMHIKVIVPKDTIIEPPKIIDENKIKNTKFSYESKEGDTLKLPNEGSFMTLNKGKDEKTILYFDPTIKQFYSEKPFKVDNLEVGTFRNSASGKTVLIFKEDDVNSFKNSIKQNFLYLGNKNDNYKLVLGAFTHDSASVRFVPTSGNINYAGIKITNDDMLAIQARGTSEKSIITVSSRDGEKNIPLIKAEGEYDMFHGNSYISYTKSGGLRHAYINKRTFNNEEIDFAKKNAINVEIDSKDSGNNEITQTFKDKSGKEVAEKVNWNIFVDKNNLRLTSVPEAQKILRSVSFNQLDPMSQAKLLSLKKEDQIRLIGKDFNIMVEELKKIQIISFGNNIVVGKFNNPPQSSISTLEKIRHVKDIYQLGNQYEDNDPVTAAHETSHGISSGIRNSNMKLGHVNGYYFPEYPDKYFILTEPNFQMSDVLAYTPENLRGTGFYDTYLIGQQGDWNDRPLYIFDELTAYANGAMVSVEGNYRRSINIPEAMSSSISLGRTIKSKDTNYWNGKTGTQFKEFLMMSLERSMSINIKQYGSERAHSSFNRYLDQNSIIFLKETYGEEWTKKVFGI